MKKRKDKEDDGCGSLRSCRLWSVCLLVWEGRNDRRDGKKGKVAVQGKVANNNCHGLAGLWNFRGQEIQAAELAQSVCKSMNGKKE